MDSRHNKDGRPRIDNTLMQRVLKPQGPDGSPMAVHRLYYAACAMVALGFISKDKREERAARNRWRALHDPLAEHTWRYQRIGIMAELGRLYELLQHFSDGKRFVQQAADIAVSQLEEEWRAKAIEADVRLSRLCLAAELHTWPTQRTCIRSPKHWAELEAEGEKSSNFR